MYNLTFYSKKHLDKTLDFLWYQTNFTVYVKERMLVLPSELAINAFISGLNFENQPSILHFHYQ